MMMFFFWTMMTHGFDLYEKVEQLFEEEHFQIVSFLPYHPDAHLTVGQTIVSLCQIQRVSIEPLHLVSISATLYSDPEMRYFKQNFTDLKYAKQLESTHEHNLEYTFSVDPNVEADRYTLLIALNYMYKVRKTTTN